MATFHLKVLTVDKQFFDGEVDRIVVRTSQGDVGILPNHVPYVAALGVGGLTIIRNGERRVAAVSGGFVDVSAEQTVVLARTCEWADEIDVARAREAADRRPECDPQNAQLLLNHPVFYPRRCDWRTGDRENWRKSAAADLHPTESGLYSHVCRGRTYARGGGDRRKGTVNHVDQTDRRRYGRHAAVQP